MHHLATGEAVPAVPFAFDALLGAVTMVLVLAALVCYGLREAWGHTVGYGLRWLANEIEDVSIPTGFFGHIHPFGFLADALRHVDHVVGHSLAVAALNTESAAVSMWHMTAVVFWWSVHETKALSVDVFHALEHVVTHRIPDAAKWARRQAEAEASRIVHREAALRRGADAELRHLGHVAEADAIHAEHAAAHALDWSEAQVGHIGREISGIRARLRHIERLLTPAGVVGLVIAALSALGLGFLRCPNLRELGKKRGCGVWSGLENLLAAIAAFGIAADFRDVVKASVAIEGEAARALGRLASLDDAAVMDAAQAVAKAANTIAGA